MSPCFYFANFIGRLIKVYEGVFAFHEKYIEIFYHHCGRRHLRNCVCCRVHHQSFSNEVVQEKSDQEKAEEFAEKMKPKIEERLHEEDIHNFIRTITF